MMPMVSATRTGLAFGANAEKREHIALRTVSR